MLEKIQCGRTFSFFKCLVFSQNFCILSQEFGQTLPVYFTTCSAFIQPRIITMECFIEFNFELGLENKEIGLQSVFHGMVWGHYKTLNVISRSQIFRLTAEGLEFMVNFIGQGPSMRPFDRHAKQPITVCFVQRHVVGRGNVATITDSQTYFKDSMPQTLNVSHGFENPAFI